MMMRVGMFVPIVLSAVVLLCAYGCAAEPPPGAVLVEFEPVDFAPLKLIPDRTNTFDLLVSDDLERTPRDYVKITASVKGSGTSQVTLVLVDVLNREYMSEPVDLKRDQEAEISIDMEQVGHPISMLRAVRIQLEGEPVEVYGLKVICAVEKLPEPDVTVAGPLDDTSIQAALNDLGEEGGVVYIPAGEYVINNQVTVPCNNVTIYGDGPDTMLQGIWFETKGMIVAENREDLRISRLHFRSLPLEEFRGYNSEQHAAVPEDVGRPTVTSLAVQLINCTRVRVDHVEFERFGYSGILLRGGTEICIDHCFFHENFRYGLGYGIVPCATTECYVEDNNFENHRHGVAGGRGTMASYTCRFNRFVKDINAVPAEGWKQVSSHEIDVHSGCSWLYAHDNYVEMKNGMMSSGACLRGNPAWVYRNVFVNCNNGIYVVGACDDVWTWDNEFTDCPNDQVNKATGTVTFDTKPGNFAEIPYPYALNRMGWWPGAKEEAAEIVKAETQFPGPEGAQVLRVVGAEE